MFPFDYFKKRRAAREAEAAEHRQALNRQIGVKIHLSTLLQQDPDIDHAFHCWDRMDFVFTHGIHDIRVVARTPGGWEGELVDDGKCVWRIRREYVGPSSDPKEGAS